MTLLHVKHLTGINIYIYTTNYFLNCFSILFFLKDIVRKTRMRLKRNKRKIQRKFKSRRVSRKKKYLRRKTKKDKSHSKTKKKGGNILRYFIL
jgi:hypothetical protein